VASSAANFVLEASKWQKRIDRVVGAPKRLLQLAASFRPPPSDRLPAW
jgi:hypothetical protein